MLSRWALKHVFRFILKKKLGKIILGDIDLDQLDVQLGAGSIELHDLALNVEYLNQKLGMSPVMVKDGSVGSLSVKIPWNVSNCEVEVKDLEIVLSPQSVEKVPGAVEHMPLRRVGKPPVSGSRVNIGDSRIHQDAAFTCSDVHEGVKTIANLVKCLLSNFHVKINNLLVALDPNLQNPGKTSHIFSIMVFRIAELAYGTCLSESAQTHSDSGSLTDGFLGLTKLTNFVTFSGATVELLPVIDEESQSNLSRASGLGISQSCKPFVPPIPVFTGENGLCGTLKLSMPWKNGSLDISRVDAEFHIDPVELRFYPSSIQFIIFLWDSFKFIGRNDHGSANCKATGSETGLRLVTNMDSHIGVETSPKESIPGTHLILDWVPVAIGKDKNAAAEVEPDFGASVNQFFDCLDGISSQSALSSSGIWNWTCSVFSTISAASSLASGSLLIPTEQQHVETNINATIAGVSIILSFHDEIQNGYNDMKSSGENMYINNINSDVDPVLLEQQNMLDQKTCFYSSVHYLEANLQGLNVTFQIFPQEVKFEAALKQITVNDCFNLEGKATESGLSVNVDELFREVNLVHSLQSEIQGSLPPFPFSFQDSPDMSKNVSQSDTVITNLHLGPVDTKVQGDGHRPISKAKYVKMNILRTSTFSEHLISVISQHANGKPKASTSFFVRLPPIIMWVNLNTVNMLLDLCNQIEKTAVPNLSGTSDASSHGPQDHKGFDQTSGDMANPTVVSVQGNIVLAETRTIVCFPLQRCGDSKSLYFHNNFVVFDLCPSERTDIAGETFHMQNGCSGGSFNYMPSTSIHLNIGSFSAYLISKPDGSTSEGNLFVYSEQSLSAKEIFSSIAGTCGKCSGVFIIWKADAVTDMHIAKRAWDMATSRNFSRNKGSRRKCEFASVATVSDQEGISSQVHRELISASGFSFRIHFARAIVSLGPTEYALLLHLISQVLDVLSNGSSAKTDVNTREGFSKDKLQSRDVKFFQSSFLLECDVLDISVKLNEALDVSTSIQKELPGSWASARLTVQNFELLSGSNIGGMPSSSILWVSHGEGELWGSIVREVGGTSEDLMLVCARNSAMRRGDGGGANALSSGFAGTSIVHLSYPDMLQTSTSITLKCGTLLAPGGRLDWLAAISSFFCVPASEVACSSDADRQKDFSQKEKIHDYESSFFLELLDVGLSYEPYQKGVTVGKQGVKSACPDTMKSTGKNGEQGVACLLAAASLYVSSRNSDGATSNDYKIGIQDIGLLLSDLPALGNLVDYDVRHLRSNNYVKVAGETLVEVILKTNSKDCTWGLTCSGCHVKINTCHDTTAGLIFLGTQLQQLFAPDITESVLHLQTRWNTVMQGNNDRDEAKVSGGDMSTSPLIMQAASIYEDNKSWPLGLMDEILDDVFREEAGQSLNLSETLTDHPSSSETVPDDECFLQTSKNSNASLNASSNLLHQPEQGNLGKSSPNCLPEFIDDYYVLDTFSAQSPGGYHKRSETGPSSRATGSNMDNGKSGWYDDGSFCIVENHIPIVDHHEGCMDSASFEHSSSTSALLAEDVKKKGRIILENVNVTWAMFAGSDWSSSRCNSSDGPKRGGRDTDKCLELSLLGMNIKYDIFPDGKLNVSNLSVSVQDVHVYDNSKEAPWKMVLGYYHSKLHPRENHAKAVNLILETVKPDPLVPLEEYRLRLSLLPLRLHLHQSQVDFLVSFFSQGHPSSDRFSSVPNDLDRPCTFATSVSQLNVVEEALLPFFQKCDIYPSILRVDYIPQHVDLAALGGGHYVELLNLVPWKGIELRLKYVHAAGIYGWNSVCETVIGEWLEDISHNQVRELIKGLVPVRSLCSVGSGAAKLISLPVTNYRKDHKLLKGLQRGAIAFLRSVSLEAVALGVHLAGGAHDVLLQTEYILQKVPPSIHTASRDRGDAAVRVNQPNNAQEGVQQAYKTLAHGFGKSASALVGNPMKSYSRGASAGSALASAAKSAPAAAVAPATAAVGAIHCALLGVRNSLDPERKRESMEKYSGPSCLHHKPMR